MDVQEFVEQVNDAQRFPREHPHFLMSWVLPNRKAFLQFVQDVILLETLTADEWMDDPTRRRYGWPQQIQAAFEAFKEQTNEQRA